MIIHKVKKIKSKQIIDERGKILLFHNKNSILNHRYSEIYCSKIRLNQIKAWRMHKRIFSLITLVYGKVKLAYCYENGLKKNIKEIILSVEENFVVRIPPKTWYGFKSIGDCDSLVSNILSEPYEENEIKRAEYNLLFPKYDWSTKNR